MFMNIETNLSSTFIQRLHKIICEFGFGRKQRRAHTHTRTPHGHAHTTFTHTQDWWWLMPWKMVPHLYNMLLQDLFCLYIDEHHWSVQIIRFYFPAGRRCDVLPSSPTFLFRIVSLRPLCCFPFLLTLWQFHLALARPLPEAAARCGPANSWPCLAQYKHVRLSQRAFA